MNRLAKVRATTAAPPPSGSRRVQAGENSRLTPNPWQFDQTVSGSEGARKNLNWLPGLDSNQGFQLQRLTCYPYTTGHCGMGRLRNYLFPAAYSRFVGYQRQGAGS